MLVVFTPLAERQIERLHSDIAEQASEERADGYVGRIVALCKGFAMFPERGTRRNDTEFGYVPVPTDAQDIGSPNDYARPAKRLSSRSAAWPSTIRSTLATALKVGVRWARMLSHV